MDILDAKYVCIQPILHYMCPNGRFFACALITEEAPRENATLPSVHVKIQDPRTKTPKYWECSAGQTSCKDGSFPDKCGQTLHEDA